jgi:biotin carboxyl carrier protein
MDYRIAIDDDIKEVALNSVGDAESKEYLAKISEDNERRIVLLHREKNRLIVSIEGKVYSIIQSERSKHSVSFLANGVNIRATLQNQISEQSSSSLIATANELIASNFPAKVVKLLVQKGDSRKEGETLVILEAMKMEAQIKAPRDCIVEEVFVKEGEMVERGKSMIRLKFD